MKRRISIYLMSAVAMFAAVGCTVEDIVKINESDVIVPVLHNPGLPEVITITPSNQSDEIEFTWDAAHIGFGAQLNYTVEVSLSPDKSVRTYELTGGVASTTSSVKYEDLNYSLIYSLGVKPAESAEVYFYVSAAVGTKKYLSEPLAAKVVPTDAPKQFPHIYLIGSYCDWNHTQAQLMYDYSENGLEYQGLIDFGEEFMTTTFQGFKLTPEETVCVIHSHIGFTISQFPQRQISLQCRQDLTMLYSILMIWICLCHSMEQNIRRSSIQMWW